jgi:hypothetical protein
MGEIHIQLDYIFDRSIATNVTEPTPSTTVKSNTRETKLSHVTINHPKDKSQVTAIHLQGIAAKDDPAYQPLKDAIDQLRAQITVTSPTLRAVKISAIKQPDYIHCEQVKSLLMGAGATDVTLANVEHNIAYGVKLEGKYNDTSFCVLVYHQFSGSLNQNPETRSAVWEKPDEDDPRIVWLRRTLDTGIESNKCLQRKAASEASEADLVTERLTSKIVQISLSK